MKLFLSGLSNGIPEQLIINGLTYPNSLGVQPLANCMVSTTFTYQCSPAIWRVLDKTFISYTTPINDLNKSRIIVYDHFTGKCSNSIDTGMIGTRGDIHHFANIIQTNENKLVQVQDTDHGSSRLNQSLSSSNFQVNSNWTVRVQSETTYDSVYPHTFLLNDNSLIDIRRRARTATGVSIIEIYTSIDASVWTKKGDLINWADANTVTSNIPYHGAIYNDDNIIRIWIGDYNNERNATPIGWTYLFYMESNDNGNTWRNAGNTFSKNVIINGALTHAECVSNYVAVDQTVGLQSNWSLKTNSGIINGSDIYLLGAFKSNYKPHLNYWNGSVWITREVIIPGEILQPVQGITDDTGAIIPSGSSNNKNQLIYKNNALYFYGTVFYNTQKGRLIEAKSIDNGLNWTLERFLTDTSIDVGNIGMAANEYRTNRKLFASVNFIDSNGGIIYVGKL